MSDTEVRAREIGCLAAEVPYSVGWTFRIDQDATLEWGSDKIDSRRFNMVRTVFGGSTCDR